MLGLARRPGVFGGTAGCTGSSALEPPTGPSLAQPPTEEPPLPRGAFAREGVLFLRQPDSSVSLGVSVWGDLTEDRYQLQLWHRFSGALVSELLLDRTYLRLRDPINKRYFSGENTAEVRRALFGIDLSPPELAMLLTARLPLDDRIDLQRYTFRWRPDGLLHSWRKPASSENTAADSVTPAGTGYRVLYDRFATFSFADGPLADGALVKLPGRVRVWRERNLRPEASSPQASVQAAKPLLILGLRDYQPRPQAPPSLAADAAPPDATWTPLELPALSPAAQDR